MRTDRLSKVPALAAGVALLAWFVYLVRGGLASWFSADDLMNMHIYWARPWPALLKANLAFWSTFYRPAGGLFYRPIFDLWGLASWFSADDLMNMHIYWARPWPALLKANLAFWSTFYRPAGGLFYRPIFDLWGFHPLPFHIAALALLSVDFALLALVVWQLTGSRWGALIALMLLGINPSASNAYFDTGNIYDVLAYKFFWGAFALYVHSRQAGRPLGWGRLALVFGLFVAALDAKEISVSLPVAVGLYELVWHPPANWRPAELWRWIRQEGRFAVIGGLADIAYIVGKRYGPDSLWLAS